MIEYYKKLIPESVTDKYRKKIKVSKTNKFEFIYYYTYGRLFDSASEEYILQSFKDLDEKSITEILSKIEDMFSLIKSAVLIFFLGLL